MEIRTDQRKKESKKEMAKSRALLDTNKWKEKPQNLKKNERRTI